MKKHVTYVRLMLACMITSCGAIVARRGTQAPASAPAPAAEQAVPPVDKSHGGRAIGVDSSSASTDRTAERRELWGREKGSGKGNERSAPNVIQLPKP